jgi:signaling intermediate in Toll pathway protein
VPTDALELAKMAIERITSVDRLTQITVYDANEIPESLDKTWIVSGQSPEQKEMITKLAKDKALYVEGGFRVWLREAQVCTGIDF